jgi:type VI secretion system protein ImpB
MPQESGQKHIGSSGPRKPRVHIEYKLENYGSELVVKLPMVMGVMADLSGKPADPLPPVNERNFLEIDAESFNGRMKAIRPRVAFTVPNTLTGEESLPVDMTFENLGDFAPDAVARKVEPLRKLLESREQLARLLSYMDGKASAEKLVSTLLSDPDMQARVLAAAKPDDTAAAPPAPTG